MITGACYGPNRIPPAGPRPRFIIYCGFCGCRTDTLRNGRGFDPGDPNGGIRFCHVLGHQGDKFNERADYLATQAIKRVPKRGR